MVSEAQRKSGSEAFFFFSFNKYLLNMYYVPGTVLGHGRITNLTLNISPLILICWEPDTEKCCLSLVVPNKTFFIGDLSSV